MTDRAFDSRDEWQRAKDDGWQYFHTYLKDVDDFTVTVCPFGPNAWAWDIVDRVTKRHVGIEIVEGPDAFDRARHDALFRASLEIAQKHGDQYIVSSHQLPPGGDV